MAFARHTAELNDIDFLDDRWGKQRESFADIIGSDRMNESRPRRLNDESDIVTVLGFMPEFLSAEGELVTGAADTTLPMCGDGATGCLTSTGAQPRHCLAGNVPM